MPPKARTSPKTNASPAEIRELADRLHSSAIHLLRRLRRVDDSTGLTAPKLSALSVIVFGGPITLGDLAKTEQVRPPTMTHLVRELQRGGLVRTRTDPQDRRVTWVEATARGVRLLTKGRSRRIELLAQWLGQLEKSEFHLLKNAIGTLEGLVRPDESSNR
jgi:DNA-binding MarR family transcriptional regulator